MQSMSMSADVHAEKHNIDAEYRAGLDNVDAAKTADNVNIRTETIEEAYGRIFGAATEAYNAQQVAKGHPERQISSYLEKVTEAAKADGRKRETGEKWRKGRPDPCVEYVGQIGSHETWAEELTEEEAIAIYRETFERVDRRTRGAIDWFQSSIHVDEPKGAPHLHMTGIPIGDGYKRGMEVQVSMRKALEKIGVKDLPALQALLLDTMEQVAEEHGIVRQVMGCEEPHRSGRIYQQAMDEQRRINETNERKRELGRELDARNAQAEDRLECLQQSADTVESAKEPVAKSVVNLIQNRGAGSRERELAAEKSELGEGIGELERQVAEARGRVEQLERGLPGLRERHRVLGERFETLGQRVTTAISGLREVPNVVSRWAREIAERLGKRVYDPRSLEHMARQASEAARLSNSARESHPQRRRGLGGR